MEKQLRKGYDGKQLAFLEWRTDAAKANILFVHGVKEHSGRYKRFAEFLTGHGFNVFAGDLRAHGNTDTPGFTAEKDVFKSIIMDLIVWGEELKATGLPLIIIGHSFGSFLAQRLLSLIKADLFILCGSTYMRTADIFLGKVMAGTAILFGRGEDTALTVEKLSYGRFKKQSTGGWLSTSKESYQDLKKDNLCGKPLNNNFYRSMFSNSLRLYGKDMGSANLNTPILLLSGTSDPVGGKGTGVGKLYKAYKNRGLMVSLKMMEGLKHDLINDCDHCGQVHQIILDFITENLPKNQNQQNQ